MRKIRKNIVLLTIIFSLVSTTSLTSLSSTIYLSPEINAIVSKWLIRSVIKGYPDGNLKLTEPMTRAEFAAVICRLFGFSDIKNSVAFSDVPDMKWYSSLIQKVVSKKVMPFDSFKSTYLFHPASFITYQEAVDSILKAYKLNSLDDLKLNIPSTDTPLTRLDCIVLVDRITKEFINNACSYTADVDGNLIINTSNVTLKDMTIDGNLYLTEGIGTGCITLDNVLVKGVVHVNGCGENSLIIKNKSSINSMIVENQISTVRVSADSDDTVKKLILLTPTILDGPLSVSDPESRQYAIYPFQDIPITDSNSSGSSSSSSKDTVPPNINPPIIELPPVDEPDTDPPNPELPPVQEPDNNQPDTETPPIEEPHNEPPPTQEPNPNPPTTTDSTIHLITNICIDFNDYPSLNVTWNKVTSASSYTFSIANSLDLSPISTLQTTDSSILFDPSYCLVIPDNEYTISITAASDNDFCTTTANLRIPDFSLHEESNGTLCVEASENLSTEVVIKNFNLCLLRERIDPDGSKNYISENIFDVEYGKTLYPLPITPINDTAYCLKISNTSIPANDELIIDSYTASYFKNVSYSELNSPSCTVGTGENNPISLTTVRHLRNLSEFVNSRNPTEGKFFKLLNDLDFTGSIPNSTSQEASNFVPIGVLVDDPTLVNNRDSTNNIPFKGDFDGGNHHISNLILNASPYNNASFHSYNYLGLFSLTRGSIKNIILDANCRIGDTPPNRITAGIVAFADYSRSPKIISGCYNYADITGSGYTAGIVGHIYTGKKVSSSLKNCCNYGSITSSYASAGIAGVTNVSVTSSLDIINCHNYGPVTSKAFAGGIISESLGSGTSIIKYCYNFNNITSQVKTLTDYAISCGGILGSGSNKIDISNCLNGGDIISYYDINSSRSVSIYVGGIIGQLTYIGGISSILSNNYNYGDISAHALTSVKGSRHLGPILASLDNYSTITNCYTISYVNPVPDNLSNTQRNIFAVFYTEFIDKVKNALPDIASYAEPFILQHIGNAAA
ncbi:MAG: Glucan endo,3-beta-D-glucosidase [Clostridia bacterium]|jgi:hypothetical protein|nr:Glucan endo,3-beta-D-glucosidase [Clostridia bacterium]